MSSSGLSVSRRARSNRSRRSRCSCVVPGLAPGLSRDFGPLAVSIWHCRRSRSDPNCLPRSAIGGENRVPLTSTRWLTIKPQSRPAGGPGPFVFRDQCDAAGLGECPEWQRGRTVNPLAYAFVGSSPASPTSLRALRRFGSAGPVREGCRAEVAKQRRRAKLSYEDAYILRARIQCGCSSMVEQQPSKLMTRVRFPSPAPTFAPLALRSASQPRSRRIAAEASAKTG